MPPAGGAARGEALGDDRAACTHDRLVAPELGALLDAAEPTATTPLLVRACAATTTSRAACPASSPPQMTRAGSDGYEAWLHGARGQRLRASSSPRCGATSSSRAATPTASPRPTHPYDPLLDRYEPGTTTAQVRDALRAPARRARAAALARSPTQPAPPALPGDVPGRRAARGRPRDRAGDGLRRRAPGAWTTPCTRSPPSPSRAATCASRRASTTHSLTGLFALMHEVGHGLYEHGVDPALARTTLDTGVSLGVHESQSRLWENLVGRSAAVLDATGCRALRERFPQTLGDVDLDDFLRAINVVRPTLDPRRGRRGDLLAARHPALRARARARSRARSTPPTCPRRGRRRCARCSASRCPTTCAACLQDIHWSEGIIGYFPTYAIGNVARRAAVARRARRPARPRRRSRARRATRAARVAASRRSTATGAG